MEYRHDIPGADDLWLIDLQNSYFTTENSLSNKLDFSGNIHGPVNVDLHLTGNFLTRQINDRRIYFQSLHKSNFLLDGVMTLTYGANAWEDGANYKLNVSYSEDAPKMLDLLTIADNSDPLFHTLGNPSLTKSSRYAAEIAFSHNRTAGKRKIELYAGYSCVDRAVTIARFYNRRTGITTMSPQNINGNFEVSVNADYSRFIGRNDCLFLSNTFRGELLRSADYSSDSENLHVLKVNNWRMIDKIKVKYMFGKVDLSARIDLDLNRLISLNNVFSTFGFMNINYGISASLPVAWGIELQTDLMAYCRRGYEDPAMNSTDWVWNLQLSKTFGRSKQFTVKAVGFDLLGQLPTVKQVVNAQGRTETRYNSQPAYALLTLTYRLDLKPKKK